MRTQPPTVARSRVRGILRLLTSQFRWDARVIVPWAALVILIATAPALSSWFDQRGVAGASVMLVLLAIAAIGCVYAASTTLPRGTREREIALLAAHLAVPFEERFMVPESLHALPFWSLVPGSNRSVSGGFTIKERVVFVRSFTLDEYEATQWRTCAATRVPMDLPQARIEPRGLGQTPYRLREVVLEYEAFDRRWRVRSADPLFAEALVDQRMMDWLMSVGALAFETGGSWVMVETEVPDASKELLGTLEAFVERTPRVVAEMYPKQP